MALLISLASSGMAVDAQSSRSVQVAPQTRGNFVIAMVLPRDEQDIEVGFKDYLRKRNVPVRYVSIRDSGKPEEIATLITQVRQSKPDLIYSWGTTTTLALAGAYDAPPGPLRIRDIPIVFAEVTDPVGSRLVISQERPGGNMTGVSHVAPLVVQFNTMKAYRPISKLGFIAIPSESNTLLVHAALANLARRRGFELVVEWLPIGASGLPEESQIPQVIRRIAARKVDFLYIPPSTFLALTHRDLVTGAALAAGVPTFCATESVVRKAKCLFGLFSSGSNVGRFAAYKASQILLDGKSVALIPVESLKGFTLLINMKVAKTLQLYPPLSLLSNAEVIFAEEPRTTSTLAE